MEYRLFKPTYTDRQGQRQTAEKYYVEFRDHLRVKHRWPMFTTEKQSRAVADKIIRLVEYRLEQKPADEKLSRWAETTAPDDIRQKLSESGIIDAGEMSRREPLRVHLRGKLDEKGELLRDEKGNAAYPGWKQSLTTGRTDRDDYAEMLVGRVERVFNALDLKFWKDLRDGDVVSRIETYLGKLRTDGEISGQTFNYYVREIKSFCRWMVKNERAASMVLENLRPVNDAEADKRERRAFSVDEVRCLLASLTAQSPIRYHQTPADRAFLYRFAFETGMRPGQIRKLTVARFDLDSDPPTVTAHASTVKRRKVHVQVLRPGTAAELAKRFATKVPTAQAIEMPDKFSMARMLREDLKAARDKWIEEAQGDAEKIERHKSDFLADENHEGHRADFYSLRHTHGTELGNAGTPEKDIAASMHHATRVTTVRYLHSDLVAKQRAVNSLPDVAPNPMILAATGTDDATGQAARLRTACATRESSGDIAGQVDAVGSIGGGDSESKTPQNIRAAGIEPARDFSQRILSPESESTKQGHSNDYPLRLTTACATPETDSDLLALLAVWPKLSEKQRRQVSALVVSMVG